MKNTVKKTLILTTALVLALCLTAGGALACTTIYVGKALSADGSVMFARSEDYANSSNKLFYVSPAGKNKGGVEYAGCYGFTYTFSHDSYGYTAFSDDNGEAVDHVCPDCDDTHEHSPYEAAGTNDQGLSVTATETIYGDEALEEVDPFEDLGIEEAEIVTVLLGECATAKEAVTVLTGIYDGAGCNSGSGIIVADAAEAWYIENVTGHQYIAVKLSDTMVLVEPNMVIIGEIDLDDADNVVASAGLIETAQAAGTFVGDADSNIINYVLSYCVETQANPRMVNALAFLDEAYADPESIDPLSAYCVSNTDAEGNIVAMHTGINPKDKLSIEDIQAFYHIDNIGYVRNMETHIFQITDDTPTGTIEWVSMNDAALNVFIPYYPMLTTDVAPAYKLSTLPAEFSEEEPESGLYYPTTVNRWVDGERVAVNGFMTLPENWADSFYWTFDTLSNLCTYTEVDETLLENIKAALAAQQTMTNEDFAAFAAGEVTAETATYFSREYAEASQILAVALVEDLIGE